MANAAASGGQGNTDTSQGGGAAAGATGAAGSTGATGEAGKSGDAGKGTNAAGGDSEAGKAGTDGKPAAGDVKPGTDDKGAAAATPKAPEKYALKIPEKSTIDDSDLKVIEAVARENNWSNDEAQAALDRHNSTLVEQSARFLEETKADKVYGGDNLATTQARAKAVLDRVRPADSPRGKAIRALLDKSGYGNHIEIVSLLADLGKMTEEDSPGSGSGGAKGEKSVESILYDKG
jgi:hypothetical protein